MTAADDETPRLEHLVSQAADLFVYAPIGLFFEGPSIVAKLAEQGRARADNARLFGPVSYIKKQAHNNMHDIVCRHIR